MELIFEIGCEELPARFIDPALDQMRTAFVEHCDERRIDVDGVDVAGTPRRLTLLVRDLADTQRDLEEQRTGPPADIAYEDGEPTAAAEGFARGQGVDVDDLYVVETDKGQYVAADVFEQGEPTDELLAEILTEIITDLDFPKSMRWGSRDVRFGRPVRWLTAVADGQLVDVEFAGVDSEAVTYGHRFSSPGPVEFETVDGYLEGLKKADVTADPDRRRSRIVELLDEHGSTAGGRVVDDPELIDEVTHLVEKAQAVTLDFSDEYLELPREVLITSMRSHQRYFAVEETDASQLLSACVVIYNTPVEDPQVVADGNLKVLRARLDDARFFWDKDREIPLQDHRDGLKDVVWIGDLGTTFERTERLEDLADRIGALLELDESDREYAGRAGLLSKADLVTDMVEEFPKLQGVMGREYALEGGEPRPVATAIEEQYLPGSADGPLPETDVGAAVAVAEKLDAIVGCFGVDMIPTSSSDPFGLRRAALGVLRILEDRASTTSIAELVEATLDVYEETGRTEAFADDNDVVKKQVLEFIKTRFHYLLEEYASPDVVRSVLNTHVAGGYDVPSVYGRIRALAQLQQEADFEPLAQGFKRVVNIVESQSADAVAPNVDESLFKEPQEEALHDAAQQAETELSGHLEDREWTAACETLIGLKDPIDEFFETVMVNAGDDEVRANRLALLKEVRELFNRVADISEIQT